MTQIFEGITRAMTDAGASMLFGSPYQDSEGIPFIQNAASELSELSMLSPRDDAREDLPNSDLYYHLLSNSVSLKADKQFDDI